MNVQVRVCDGLLAPYSRRRVLGEDHPKTLTSANNLVLDLRAVGEHEQARQLKDWIQSQGGP
jgi:hypothetical protein